MQKLGSGPERLQYLVDAKVVNYPPPIFEVTNAHVRDPQRARHLDH